MKKIFSSWMLACVLATSMAAFAQDQMKQDNMNDNMAKAVSVSGKVSADGKMFTSDKDNKMWTVSNPEALKGHEGHHVTIKARIDAARNQIDIASVKMAKDEMKDTMKKDEMQH